MPIDHVRDLTPDPANARRHNARNVDLIADALREVGAARSIVIDETGRVLAGNATVAAAAAAGLSRVQVVDAAGDTIIAVRRSGLTDHQKTRLALYDNRTGELADWDSDVLAALQEADAKLLADLWTGDELDELLAGLDQPEAAADPGAQIDRADELQAKWQTERGQLWQIGRHRLLCGDSTNADDVARLMAGERIELVWTDPPYGVAVGDKNKYLNSIARSNRVEENLTGDTLSEPALAEMLSAAFDHAIAHCTAGAAWYVAAPPGPLHVLFGQALKDRGIWRQTLIWVKNNATFSPLGVDYHWRAEPIFYGWVPNAGHRYYGGRQQDTVWEIDRPTASPEHPTMKPVELVRRAVENSSRSGEIVYDAFAGSGTSLVAAEQTGRRCYACEIEPKYVAVTLERLAGMGLEPRRVSADPATV